MADTTFADRPDLEVDPVLKHSLREAKFILGVWLACFAWTCTYCYLYGYVSHEPKPGVSVVAIGELVGPLESFNRDPATALETPLDLGIPGWVFYGILLPWIACVLVSIWYCLFFFVEDDLGVDVTEAGGTPYGD